MNPFSRFFDFIGNPSHSRTLGILAVLIIALAIPLTVNIAQKQQELRQHAAGNCQTISLGTFCSDISVGIPDTKCTPTSDPSAQCPGNGQKFSCSQSICTGIPTPPPADLIAVCNGKGGICQLAPCGTNQSIIGSCPNNQVCCANTVTPPPATSNPQPITCPNTDGFTGESCNQGSAEEYTKSTCPAGYCQVISCFKNRGGSNYCKYNRGRVPEDCYSYPDADFKCNNPLLASASVTPTPIGTLPICDVQTGQSVCTAKTNTCNGEGAQTILYTVHSSGKPCQPPTPAIIKDCALDSKANNCNTGNVCTNGLCTAPSAVQSVIVLSNLTLDGLGTAGDVKNRSQKPNSPQGGKRKALVELFNLSTSTLTSASQVPLQLNGNGTFTVSASFTNVPTANYTVKIKPDGYLKKSYGVITVSSPGQTVTLANPLTLTAADVNGDNKLNILDFNIISSCFGQSGSGSCSLADSDDSGIVDLIDFNLYLRELNNSTEQSGD